MRRFRVVINAPAVNIVRHVRAVDLDDARRQARAILEVSREYSVSMEQAVIAAVTETEEAN